MPSRHTSISVQSLYLPYPRQDNCASAGRAKNNLLEAQLWRNTYSWSSLYWLLRVLLSYEALLAPGRGGTLPIGLVTGSKVPALARFLTNWPSWLYTLPAELTAQAGWAHYREEDWPTWVRLCCSIQNIYSSADNNTHNGRHSRPHKNQGDWTKRCQHGTNYWMGTERQSPTRILLTPSKPFNPRESGT